MPHGGQGSPVDPEMDDAACLRRLADGDDTALAELVGRHESALRRYLRHVLVDTSWTEDALQEVFLRVLVRASTYDPAHSPRVWLFRIARNLAIDFARRAARRRDWLLRQHEERAGQTAPDASTPVLDDEFHARLRAELASLPEELATAFVLRELDQLSYTDIAQIMGTGEKTVSTRLHRARLRLRHRLAEWLREEPA